MPAAQRIGMRGKPTFSLRVGAGLLSAAIVLFATQLRANTGNVTFVVKAPQWSAESSKGLALQQGAPSHELLDSIHIPLFCRVVTGETAENSSSAFALSVPRQRLATGLSSSITESNLKLDASGARGTENCNLIETAELTLSDSTLGAFLMNFEFANFKWDGLSLETASTETADTDARVDGADQPAIMIQPLEITPVPEPSALGMLAMGLGALALWNYRRFSRQ
jgi:hypothetical protein